MGTFMKTGKMKLAIIGLILTGMLACRPKQENKPNIIYIYTDQQSETMMSCSGNKYLHTPAMDYLAENGMRFTRAYTTNPVCSPARVSLMTGRFPGAFNDDKGNIVDYVYRNEQSAEDMFRILGYSQE